MSRFARRARRPRDPEWCAYRSVGHAVPVVCLLCKGYMQYSITTAVTSRASCLIRFVSSALEKTRALSLPFVITTNSG